MNSRVGTRGCCYQWCSRAYWVSSCRLAGMLFQSLSAYHQQCCYVSGSVTIGVSEPVENHLRHSRTVLSFGRAGCAERVSHRQSTTAGKHNIPHHKKTQHITRHRGLRPVRPSAKPTRQAESRRRKKKGGMPMHPSLQSSIHIQTAVGSNPS